MNVRGNEARYVLFEGARLGTRLRFFCPGNPRGAGEARTPRAQCIQKTQINAIKKGTIKIPLEVVFT